MGDSQDQSPVPGTRVATTARLFIGDAGATPAYIGFLYSTSPDMLGSVPSEVGVVADALVTGFTLYKAPIVGAGADGGTVSLHAVTAGSSDASDYLSAGEATRLDALTNTTVYVYGAVLLSRDGSVVDWLQFDEPKVRPVGYEFSLTWKLSFS